MADKTDRPSALEEFRQRPVFHLAFPVTDLEVARRFYVDTLGCRVEHSTENAIELNFFGYRITACLSPVAPVPLGAGAEVDGVPLPYFGLIMDWEDWHRAVDHLSYIGIGFHIAPRIKAREQSGEQASFFLRDPAGNCLGFMAFKDAG